MCDKYSFCLDKDGKIHDGYGINSHSAICYIHGLEEDKVCKFEYNPHKDYMYGGIKGLDNQSAPFEVTNSMVEAIDRHVNRLFPTIQSWDDFTYFKTDENIIELIKLSNDPNRHVRRAVAGSINTPIDVLIKLSDHPDNDVRYTVAGNINTPVDVLIKLSTDLYWYVRCVVAGNINTPIDVLIKLSTGPDSDVRCAVAENINTPIDILIKLSTDPDNDVRRAVAGSINTPIDILTKLSNDPDSD
jgi:hypothetical protein